MGNATSNQQLIEQGTATRGECKGIHIASAPQGIDVPLREITAAFPTRFAPSTGSWSISFRRNSDTKPSYDIRVIDDNEIVITYSEAACAFRALGILMGLIESGLPPESISEHSCFRTIGAMVDTSRNGVPRIETIKKLIRHFALMGINQLMLYTEDTYEIPDEPMFGYFRGGYSSAELSAIDDYAASFGLEVVPCIQALGHLEQVLQWPAYRDIKDTNGVLLAGDDKTNQFVEKMIRAASAPFRSNRIHIGMDEAHGIGSGIYRQKNGPRSPYEILSEHLVNTVSTCRRLGLKPMIWSDMFFRLSSPSNSYYDVQSTIDPDIAKAIPEDVQLVYWDYYHTDKNFYTDWINRHRALGKNPIFAAGIWSWNRFWAQLPHSMQAIEAGMSAARDEGLEEAFVTMWGDDGMECDLESVLPALQCFSDHAYSADASHDELRQNFLGSVGGSVDHWLLGSALDILPVDSTTDFESNASKWILWQDPLLNHFERQLKPEFISHFKQVAEDLAQDELKRPEDACTQLIRQTAVVMALKTELHLSLRPAYLNRDLENLLNLKNRLIGRLEEELTAMRDLHEIRWHTNYQNFGWDVIERRYAGLMSRLNTLRKRLDAFLTNHNNTIPELECTPALVWPIEETHATTINYRQAASPSFIG